MNPKYIEFCTEGILVSKTCLFICFGHGKTCISVGDVTLKSVQNGHQERS